MREAWRRLGISGWSGVLLPCFPFLAAYAQEAPENSLPFGVPSLPDPEVPAPPPLPEHVSPWLVIGVLLLLGLLVTGTTLLLFGLKAAGSPGSKRPVRDALRALKELRNHLDVVKPAEAAHEVSEILRRFYQARYSIPAPFRTSQELFPNVDLSQEPLRRRLWRERYEPLAAVYDKLSYAPVQATREDVVRLIDEATQKLDEERLNENSSAN
ncbi:MAG: hypothetical protein JWO94_3237 [Verrucomicrobiaceae bacterium]|nr:hypothetical protein [Verrucomicrobiaceae bacterium]